MNKFTLIAGPCAIEEREIAFLIAKKIKKLCQELNINFIFKGSYKKANRSKLDSFTGINEETALNILKDINAEFNIETITDIHESHEAKKVSKYVNHLQIPAFLCRQTDLLLAAGNTGLGVNIKKGQFMSPDSMKFAVEKVLSTKNKNVWLCERGNSFGYNDLIVDATSIFQMKQHGVPVIMDCTHSVQKPNQLSGVTGGNPALIEAIALSAVATGANGLFIETHPDPSNAKSDPYTMLKLNKLEEILIKVMKIKNALNN